MHSKRIFVFLLHVLDLGCNFQSSSKVRRSFILPLVPIGLRAQPYDNEDPNPRKFRSDHVTKSAKHQKACLDYHHSTNQVPYK